MHDRRRDPRHEISNLTVQVSGERMEVLNLSFGGLLLLGNSDRHTGEEIDLSLPRSGRAARLRGRVVYVGPDSGGERRFRIGVAFGRLSPSVRQALQQLIDEHAA